MKRWLVYSAGVTVLFVLVALVLVTSAVAAPYPGVALPSASPASGSLSGTSDVYRVFLAKGQSLTIVMPNNSASSVDFPVWFYKPSTTSASGSDGLMGVWANTAFGPGSSVRYFLLAPETGTYYLAVKGTGSYAMDFIYPTQQSVFEASAPSTCGFGQTVHITGTLFNAIPKASINNVFMSVSMIEVGQPERSVASFVTGGTDGSFDQTVAPTAKTTYRLSYFGQYTYLNNAGTTKDLTITPRAGLGKPFVRSSVKANSKFAISGVLKPKHAAGTYGATLAIQRKTGGKYVTVLKLAAKASDSAGNSRYAAARRLSRTGKYRVRATHVDASHALTTTGWRSFTVK